MIKKIHYCWFGKNPLPEKTEKYIESWKKYCPDFEIKLWNEDNFDVNSSEFTKNAAKHGKWAFVSDYARAVILYDEGGLFVDTDVELIKGLEDLTDKSFMGFENQSLVAPGLIIYAKETHLPFFKKVIERYNSIDFDIDNMSDITSPIIYSGILEEYGLKRNNTKQEIDGIVIYPSEYFQPYGENWRAGKLTITENTRSIHHYDATWYDKYQIADLKLRKKYGEKWGRVFFSLRYPFHAVKRFFKSDNRKWNKEKHDEKR